ncbi:unnamed protein product [Discosporangium mesarthrocarpum]
MLGGGGGSFGADSEPRTNFTLDGVRRPEVTGGGNDLALPWHRSSKYKGVRANGSKWIAQINVGGVKTHLGGFDSEVQAAVAYDDAWRKLLEERGEEASPWEASDLNFPDDKTARQELDQVARFEAGLDEDGNEVDASLLMSTPPQLNQCKKPSSGGTPSAAVGGDEKGGYKGSSDRGRKEGPR